MLEKYSVEYWTDICNKRLDTYQEFRDAIGKRWFENQYGNFKTATSQSDFHPFIGSLCFHDETLIKKFNMMVKALSGCNGFKERIETLKLKQDVMQSNHRLNELMSAFYVQESLGEISFPTEVGNSLDKNIEYSCCLNGSSFGFEVKTIDETSERISTINKYKNDLRHCISRSRKIGQIGGVWGGVVAQPARFKTVSKCIKKFRTLKSGAKQASNAAVKIVHIICDGKFFNLTDFYPVHKYSNGDLKYQTSGCIFNAFYGKRGQNLYNHHFLGHGDKYSTVEKQLTDGRFIKNSNWSIAIISFLPFDLNNLPTWHKAKHIAYLPLYMR
jgi:hypothetical protein